MKIPYHLSVTFGDNSSKFQFHLECGGVGALSTNFPPEFYLSEQSCRSSPGTGNFQDGNFMWNRCQLMNKGTQAADK